MARTLRSGDRGSIAARRSRKFLALIDVPSSVSAQKQNVTALANLYETSGKRWIHVGRSLRSKSTEISRRTFRHRRLLARHRGNTLVLNAGAGRALAIATPGDD